MISKVPHDNDTINAIAINTFFKISPAKVSFQNFLKFINSFELQVRESKEFNLNHNGAKINKMKNIYSTDYL